MHRRLGLFFAVFVLLLAACGGGDDARETSSSKQRSTTTAASDADDNPDLESGDTAGDATTTTAKGSAASATATTAKGAPGTTSSGSATPSNNGVPTPAALGTYDYAQTGTTSQGPVPPNGTMVVSGSSPQTFRRFIDPEQPPSDIVYEFRADGPFITRVVVRYSFFEIACSFNAPVPAPPWPPTTGKTFSGKATCNSGFTADFSGRISGRTTDNVGGANVAAIVINSTLKVTSPNVNVTVTDTQHWAESLRLPSYSREVINGTAFGSPISGDVVSRLTSTTPR